MPTGTRSTGGRLVNQGAGTWSAGDILLINGAEFTNAQSLDVTVAGTEHWIWSGGNSGKFINAGTITRTSGLGQVRVWDGARFDNTGTLTVGTGLWYAEVGTSSGTFDVGTEAGLRLFSQTLTESSEAMGAGSVELGSTSVGGTYSVSGSTTVSGGTVDFTGAVTSVGHLTVNVTADFADSLPHRLVSARLPSGSQKANSIA